MSKYRPDTAFLLKEAAAYRGSYYSPELETMMVIRYKDEQLAFKGPKFGTAKLTVLDRKNMIIPTESGDLYLHFLIEGGQVRGFELNTGRLRRLQFDKVTDHSWWIFVASGAGVLLLTLLSVRFQRIKVALLNPVKSLRSQ